MFIGSVEFFIDHYTTTTINTDLPQLLRYIPKKERKEKVKVIICFWQMIG